MTSCRPAEILRLPVGRLSVGAPADVIRFDPDEPYVLDPASLHSALPQHALRCGAARGAGSR